MGTELLVYPLFTFMIVWLPGSCSSLPCPASHEGIRLQITSPGDENSKSVVHFLLNAYRFHVIAKSKNHKPSHRKSGTVCSVIGIIKTENRPLNLTRKWLKTQEKLNSS